LKHRNESKKVNSLLFLVPGLDRSSSLFKANLFQRKSESDANNFPKAMSKLFNLCAK